MNLSRLLEATRLDDLPRSFPDRPRVVARIKAEPEDFLVDEIPAYPATGEGQHLFLFIEKRDRPAGDFLRRVASALRVDPGEIGTAGTKDRRAVTRQWMSVPASCEARLPEVEALDDVRIIERTRHGQKLRTGHLKGNRFRILLRDADPSMREILVETARLVEARGFPNLFGSQRFGRDGENVRTGLCLLGLDPDRPRLDRRLGRFERRMVVSAVQSALFNGYVAMRIARGLDATVLRGDVMGKTLTGGLFWADDAAVEQARLDSGETRITGPIHGSKMMAARDDAGALEQAGLDHVDFPSDPFRAAHGLAEGTRRPMFIRPEGLGVEVTPDGILLDFILPKGCYASVLLREFVTETGTVGDGTDL
jgi:tRNA pseudouridine13 synthase